MKNIKVFFLSLIGVFLFCSALYGQDPILDNFIYMYDDFNGDSINTSRWVIGCECDPDEVASVSGGFLHVVGPPNNVWLDLRMPQELSGDFGIMVSFQNYSPDGNNDPGISLQADWNDDSGIRHEAFVGREDNTHRGNIYYSGYSPPLPDVLWNPATGTDGKLFIVRRGSTYQMGYNDGTQTVVLQTFKGGWTGEVSLHLMFYTASSGTFNVDVDYVKLDQSLIPLCSNITVIDSFPAPPEFSTGAPHGIAFDGKSLWAACYGCGFIYELGFDSSGDLIVVDSIEAPENNPTGITFVGKLLFAGDDGTRIISQIKTTGKKAGTVQKWFHAPGYPEEDCVGLTFARGYLYNSDFVWSEVGGAIHKITLNGDLDTTFFFPEWDSPEGLAFDGEFIWLAEMGQNRIYKLNLDDLTPVCYFEGPGVSPIGLTFDTRYLWLSDYSTYYFYKIDIGLGQ